jgi:predicted GNAT family N-acyltransferase
MDLDLMAGPRFGGLTFKLADTELQAASQLLQAVYAKAWGHVPNDGLDERAYHLVATDSAGEVVAAVRLLGPDQRPFDLERHVRLSDFIGPDRLPAQIGRLCIRDDYRTIRRSALVQMGMLKLTYDFANKRRYTDLVMYTYPQLVNFYRGSFFELVGREFEHEHWGTVIVMHLDLLQLEPRCRRSRSLVARMLATANLPNFQV